ncbi:MAG: DNA polymerase III subunit beta [Rickettsiales bacterium]|nr:DNA polymerase III subunit beta [Rickettsiales bacterium]
MKFTVERTILNRLLLGVCNVASKKNPNNPVILQNVKMETKNGFLYLVGTDADTYIKNNTRANVERDGATTVSAQLICDIVKKMEDGAEVECEYSGDSSTLSVKSGKSKFKLMCLDADGYPNFEEQEMQIEFKINPKDFATIIDKTRFSISDDPSRYYLNGLFLHTIEEEGNLKLVGVSTDGHKLAVIKLNYFGGNNAVGGVIIPKKALAEIKKVLAGVEEENVTVSLSKTKIKIETANTIIISKLIDAEFPDYMRVMPKGNDKILKVDKRMLVGTIDRVSTVVNEGHKGIKVLLTNNHLLLESNSPENGSASEEIDVDFNYEDTIDVGFNSKFMLDFFTQIESENINIYFKDSSSAIIIKGEEEQNNTFILMPIRI